jgi:hypothetical protein
MAQSHNPSHLLCQAAKANVRTDGSMPFVPDVCSLSVQSFMETQLFPREAATTLLTTCCQEAAAYSRPNKDLISANLASLRG